MARGFEYRAKAMEQAKREIEQYECCIRKKNLEHAASRRFEIGAKNISMPRESTDNQQRTKRKHADHLGTGKAANQSPSVVATFSY